KASWVLALCMAALVLEVNGQDVTVTGTVFNQETNEPLPGVNIIVKGTTTGTSSDADGAFELAVPSLSDTLVFSFIGFQSRSIPINGRTQLQVGLNPSTIAGEEMVVVGYGTTLKKDLTGAVATVTAEDIASVGA